MDTAVAHMAGGMGVKVKMYLGKMYDWRWKKGEGNWYKNIEFREI